MFGLADKVDSPDSIKKLIQIRSRFTGISYGRRTTLMESSSLHLQKTAVIRLSLARETTASWLEESSEDDHGGQL